MTVKTTSASKRASLSAAPFRAAVLVILAMAGILGLFWAYDEYRNYQFTLNSIQERYLKEYQTRLTEEMEDVIGFVEYRKSQTDELIEMELREKVQIAYISASHLYSLYKEEIGHEELKSMIVEAIRPLRWDTGKGYYFIGRTDDGMIELLADQPELERKNPLELKASIDDVVIKKMIAICLEKGAGMHRYNWSKPEVEGRQHPKVAFVKYFEPFRWFIGTGVYEDDLQVRVQEDVIERLKNLRFGKNGDVACFKEDGTTLVDFDKMRTGRLISEIVDSRGRPFGRELQAVAGSVERAGFVKYYRTRPDTNETVQRMSYVKAYPAWGWVFVTGIDMDEMEKVIGLESDRHRKVLHRDIVVFVLMLLLAIAIVAVIAYFQSMKIKHGIDLFIDFFKDAADKKIKLDEVSFQYQEFAVLGEFANRMVDERIEKEHLIHCDKLRLDSLLQLSTMTSASQAEISDFILGRILEITRSERGYIAFVNSDHTIISFQSFLENNGEVWRKDDVEISFFADKAGFPSLALQQKAAIISNIPCEAGESVIYPPGKGPHRESY
jgi:signal transduction histidine kinase